MASWPELGVQPQDAHKHATQLIAEATALLALDNEQRQKLPDHFLEAFIKSTLIYAERSRNQPPPHEILDKLNQIYDITKLTLAEHYYW